MLQKLRLRQNNFRNDLFQEFGPIWIIKNWIVKYLLCAIPVFTKCSWVKPLKDKKAETVLHDIIGVVNESKCKPILVFWIN